VFTELSGIFVKIAFARDVDILLTRNSAERPAARYNRAGEDALYLSKDEKSARIALRKYASQDDPPRVLLSFNVEPCRLLDLRHPEAKDMRQLASRNWQSDLAEGHEPASWKVADRVRESGEAGLIDPSRQQPDLWHVTLLRWNEEGAPQVTMNGEPVEFFL